MEKEKFIVSARKYRPQHFNTVVGQSHITTTLKNAIQNNQLAHAFLFCGPRGVGKTTCARILAKTINCTNRTTDTEACDKCNSCVSFNDGTSLNIHELDAASNNSVDDIRILVEQVRFAPQAGEYKVYIIDEVHMLSSSAFNAFLKTLEEPPAHAKFILATTEKHKILPTILSRCQIFDFKRITLNDTVEHLEEICEKEHTKTEKAALQVIAQKSEGCMRDALSIMDKIVSFTNGELTYKNTLEHLNILDEEFFFKFLDYFVTQNLPDTLLLFDEINKKGFEGDTLLLGLAEFIRNILVSKDERAATLLEAIESFRKKYIATAKEMDANWLISALNILNDAEINYKQARNKKLHVEMALIKLCFLNQALEAVVGGNGSNSFKKKMTKGPIAFTTKKINNLTSYLTPTKDNKKVEAAVYIETNVPQKIEKVVNKTEETPTPKVTFSSLKNLRKKVEAEKAAVVTFEKKDLNITTLKEVWLNFAKSCNEDGSNQSVQTVLELAELELINETNFIIHVGSNINMKVVDQYRKGIMQNMLQHFQNKEIQFTLNVKESLNIVEERVVTLSNKDQYIKLVEEFPLVKELKERLGLSLDY
jgi:DNA polymerase III subunit gamma/tau